MTHLAWSNNSVTIETRSTKDGRELLYRANIDFDQLHVSRFGLLEACINALPEGSAQSQLLLVRRLLGEICKQPLPRHILTEPPEKLHPSQIEHLYAALDAAGRKLQSSASGRISMSRRGRQFLRGCESRLANGDLISDLPTWKGRKRPAVTHDKLISDHVDHGARPENVQPITAISYADAVDLEAKAEAHLRERMLRIDDAATDLLNRHALYVEEIKRLKALTISPKVAESTARGRPLNATNAKNFDPMEVLAGYLQHVEQAKLFTAGGFQLAPSGPKSLREWRTSRLATHRPHLTLSEIIPVPRIFTGRQKHIEALLADYYLPSSVVLACELVLVVATGWNPGAVRSLTVSRVLRVERAGSTIEYKITGIKGKTDQLQSGSFDAPDRDLSAKDHPLAVRALTLLLDNNSNIRTLWGQTTDELFVAFSGRRFSKDKFSITSVAEPLEYGFSWLSRERVFTWLKKAYNLPKALQIRHVRHQKANLEYLRTGDIFRVQAYLDQANIKATQSYLDTHILWRIAEANMNQFMKRLAASAVFSLKPEYMERIGLCSNDVDKKLLFPISADAAVGDALCDDWLIAEAAEADSVPFVVGNEEIAFCAWQRRYYLNHYLELHASNPQRFVWYHLGRILFCLALYKVIDESEYKPVLQAAEEALRAR